MTLAFKAQPLNVHPGQLVVDAKNFQTWRVGLPEWPKNASDAYDRENIPNDGSRVIVIIYNEQPVGW